MRGARRYLLRCQEPPGSAGKVRYLRIKRPWLFVWHKICVGTRRPRGRVSAATPSACSTAVCGRRCADSAWSSRCVALQLEQDGMTAAAKYYHQGGLEWYGIKTNKLWHAEANPL